MSANCDENDLPAAHKLVVQGIPLMPIVRPAIYKALKRLPPILLLMGALGEYQRSKIDDLVAHVRRTNIPTVDVNFNTLNGYNVMSPEQKFRQTDDQLYSELTPVLYAMAGADELDDLFARSTGKTDDESLRIQSCHKMLEILHNIKDERIKFIVIDYWIGAAIEPDLDQPRYYFMIRGNHWIQKPSETLRHGRGNPSDAAVLRTVLLHKAGVALDSVGVVVTSDNAHPDNKIPLLTVDSVTPGVAPEIRSILYVKDDKDSPIRFLVSIEEDREDPTIEFVVDAVGNVKGNYKSSPTSSDKDTQTSNDGVLCISHSDRATGIDLWTQADKTRNLKTSLPEGEQVARRLLDLFPTLRPPKVVDPKLDGYGGT